MRKLLAVVFVLAGFAGGGKANMVGDVDPRQYVKWQNNPEWAHVVRLMNRGTCTGQFVAPDLILTANHCLDIPWTSAYAINYKGERFTADVLSRGYDQQQKSGYWSGRLGEHGFDWMLLKVRDSRYYSNKYLGVAQGSQPLGVQVHNAGFGALRKLDDRQLPYVRKLYLEYLRSIGEGDSGDAWDLDIHKHINGFDNFISRKRPVTDDGIVISPIYNDEDKLKLTPSCKIFNTVGIYSYPFSNNFVWSSCGGAGGNSGSALVDTYGAVVGVMSRMQLALHGAYSTHTAQGLPESIITRVDLFNSLIPSSAGSQSRPSGPSGCENSGLRRVWDDYGNGTGVPNQRRLVCELFFPGCDTSRPRSFVRDTRSGTGWDKECFYFGSGQGQYDSWAPLYLDFVNLKFLTTFSDAVDGSGFLRQQCRATCSGTRNEEESVKTPDGCPMPKPYYNSDPSLPLTCFEGYWWVRDSGYWWYWRPSSSTWIHPA